LLTKREKLILQERASFGSVKTMGFLIGAGRDHVSAGLVEVVDGRVGPLGHLHFILNTLGLAKPIFPAFGSSAG
jgi:hypothetical protein